MRIGPPIRLCNGLAERLALDIRERDVDARLAVVLTRTGFATGSMVYIDGDGPIA